MLTNLYYYEFYKPYMLQVTGGGVNSVPKRSKITDKSQIEQGKEAAFLLNKSLKSDVIGYARNVSHSVVGTKEAAKDLIIDMENFNKNVYNKDLDTARRWVSEGISHFTDTYNSAMSFLFSQSHSGDLRGFGESLAQTLGYNRENLQSLGLSLGDTGRLSYDAGYFEKLDHSKINIAIGENLNLFQNVYDSSSDVLRTPLTEHMNFKNLNYYYNYKYGMIQADTFKIIESGMLVDMAV